MVADHASAEPFQCLLRRFGDAEIVDGDQVASTSLAAVLDGTAERPSVLDYLAVVGIALIALDDLMLINDVTDEEELSAHRVVEGVALATASQGEWLLLRP